MTPLLFNSRLDPFYRFLSAKPVPTFCDGFFIDTQSRQPYTSFIRKQVPINPEAMDTGSIVGTGVEPGVIVGAVKLQTSEDILKKPVAIPGDYAIENTSERVVKLILGTAQLSNLWNGIK